MTWEEFLAIYNKYKVICKDVPNTIQDTEMLRQMFDDPEYQFRRRVAQEHKEQMDRSTQVLASLPENGCSTLPTGRFIRYQLDQSGTPAAAEFNDDLYEMQLCPEGHAEFASIALRDVIDVDYSVSFPDDFGDAVRLVMNNPFKTEQMMTAVKLNDKNHYVINPIIAEYLKYNSGVIEQAGSALGVIEFYSSDMSILATDKTGLTDGALLRSNIDNKKIFPGTPDEANSLGANAVGPHSLVNRPEEERARIRELKKAGIIGADTKYYRAYDRKGGQRLKFDKAVDDYASGKDVYFEKMSLEEQKQLDDALQKAASPIKQSDRSALLGRPFQKECGRLWAELDKVDSSFKSSSDEFRILKENLKKMADSEVVPNKDEVRQFLHELVPVAHKYLNDKIKLVNKKSTKTKTYVHSQYTQKRIDAVKAAFGSLSEKLGCLAYDSYQLRIKERNRDLSNQAKMTSAIDTNAKNIRSIKENAGARIDALANVLPSNAGDAFCRLARQAQIGLKGMKNAVNVNPSSMAASSDKEFTNGRYIAQVLAYDIIVRERTKENGAGYENSGRPVIAGTMEKLLNEVGSKAFYKGVQNCKVMKNLIDAGINVKTFADFVARGGEKKLIDELSKPENMKNISECAVSYHAGESQKAKAPEDPELGDNLKINELLH